MERNQPNTEHQEQPLQPKIYAACLAAYNAGQLHGEWIHADQEPDCLMAEVQDMLEASPIPNAEEFAVHDYEGFAGFNLHEYERLDTIARVAGGLATHGSAFARWIEEVGSDAEDADETFTDAYLGSFDSMADYAEQLIDDMGHDPIRPESEWLRPYVTIDYEALGRDMAADLVVAEEARRMHVFQTQ